MSDINGGVYPRGQIKGQVGQISRVNEPLVSDRIQIATAGLKAGQVFTLGAEGKANPLASAVDPVAIRGVLTYEVGVVQTGEHPDTVIPEYPVGDFVQEVIEGVVYGVFSEAVVKGDAVIQDPTTLEWQKTSAPVGAHAKSMTAVDNYSADELGEVRIGNV